MLALKITQKIHPDACAQTNARTILPGRRARALTDRVAIALLPSAAAVITAQQCIRLLRGIVELGQCLGGECRGRR
jgi:hypothetical protein